MRTNYEIQRDVIEQLAYDPRLVPESIGVSVDDGFVMLSGTVGDYSAKRIAEKTAGRVAGVKAVSSELCIDLVDTQIRSDQEIAHAAVHTLHWNTLLPDTIRVSVENGIIVLRGDVEWLHQKKAAERALSPLRGVRDIKNHLHVKNVAKLENVREKIKEALTRTLNEESKGIHVETEGDTVRLSGSISSNKFADAVVWAAWSSGGVSHVDNRIVVDGNR